jgi:hypothetical protein
METLELSEYGLFVDDTTGLIIGAEYNSQTALWCVLAIVMAPVKPTALNSEMFRNPVETNVVKNAQIHSRRYEEIPRIDPAQRISDPPHAYISVGNDSSHRLFSSQALCLSFSQW